MYIGITFLCSSAVLKNSRCRPILWFNLIVDIALVYFIYSNLSANLSYAKNLVIAHSTDICLLNLEWQKMINGMTVSRWACINFSRSVQDSVARTFCNELAQMCQVSGMVILNLFYYHFCLCLIGRNFLTIFSCRNLIQSLLSPYTMPNLNRWRKLWNMFTMCQRAKLKERNWSFC